MLEPGSFDACKNAIVPIIAMLGCSEIDMKVSDTGIETVESDSYREMSEYNRDANSVLAIMWERARFSCKDEWKFIDLFT